MAVERGVPLLVAGQDGVSRELERLGVQTVLVFGDDNGGWQPQGEFDVLHGREDIDQLPAFEPGSGKAAAVMLTTGAKGLPATAALATAEAAGAVTRTVEKTDPRASPDVIELLKEHRSKPVLAIGEGFTSPAEFTERVEVARNSPQLPGGGQLAFPGRRMVALYGHPGTASLGALGEQEVDAAVERVKALAAQYQPYSDEPVIPAFEIIATIATAAAGPDGDYSKESSVDELKPWVDAAAEAGVYVVLDLQPGRTDFLTQAKRYKELLKRPNVGLALDPEWRLGPGQQHMVQIGSVDASEVNRVSAWLAELTRKNDLPQKVFLLHQFSPYMITNRDQLNLGHDEIATVIHADGHGVPGSKQQTYSVLQRGLDQRTWMGWKNFIDEDTPTFTPERTYTRVNPKPWFVSYQ
ncbi:hypothetical protein GCM10027562_28980 [Arthrobacter pigmenti]